VAAGDIEDSETLKAWLDSQPRQVVNLIAGRVALRTLPLFSGAAQLASLEFDLRDTMPRRFADLAGVLFRATAWARVAGTYPTRANKLHAADADADSVAVRGIGFAIAVVSPVVVAHEAAYAAGYSYAAAFAVDAVNAAEATYHAVDRAADAAYHADAAASTGAAPAVWESVCADALVVEGYGVQALLRSRLWIAPPPDWAMRAFAALRDALPKAENWDVWHKWYEDRLNGVVYDEPRDFVFAADPTEVWDLGSAAANAWIRAELDKLAKAPPIDGPSEPPSEERLAAFANKPSPFSFEIDAATGKVDVAEHDEIAAFPPNEGEPHLRHLQTTCCEQAVNLLDDMKARRFGDFPESDFVRNLERYIKYLPRPGHIGVFFLADDHARELRALAEERATILPDTFARDLRTLLKRHEQLRGYYRRTPKIDKAICDAHSLPTPPQDKLDAVTRAIDERGEPRSPRKHRRSSAMRSAGHRRRSNWNPRTYVAPATRTSSVRSRFPKAPQATGGREAI
jgi:hypothetical protein